MAVRRRVLNPDTAMETSDGVLPYVSEGAFLEAVLAAAQVQAFAGGVLSIVVDRYPTDMPSEMVTVRAVIEWKDRTDAKPQNEPTAQRATAEEAAPPAEDAAIIPADIPAPAEAEADPERAAQINLDGLDPATLEEEDTSSVGPELVEH